MRVLAKFLLVLSLIGCGGVKGKTITAENKDRILQDIRNSHDLTVEEVGLLQRYVMRSALQDAFGGKTPSLPVGKTIGAIIKEEREAEAHAATEAHEESLRIVHARAEAEKQRAILREAVTVTVYEKRLAQGEYDASMACKVMFTNHSGKDIRGFQGTLVFNDLFGDQIIRLGLKEDDVLMAGSNRRASRYWNYNQFMDDHNRWVGTKHENMKIVWEPKTILFTDGSSLSAGKDDE